MGRKIPGRKHRGVRDPEKQRLERFDRIKDKINAPPVDRNQQEIPKSLAKFIELRDKAHREELLKKQRSKAKQKDLPISFKPNTSGMTNHSGPVYTQEPDESDKEFLGRVNQAVEEVIQERELVDKYKVQIEQNKKTGEVDMVLKRKDTQSTLQQNGSRSTHIKKMCKSVPATRNSVKSKSQKQLDKQKLRRESRSRDMIEDAVEVQHESIRFGEVAHAPPMLIRPKRAGRLNATVRPGARDLMLKGVISQSVKSQKQKNQLNNASGQNSLKIQNMAIDKKGKRKNLPVALRRQLDKQQTEIVHAYKELKKQRHSK